MDRASLICFIIIFCIRASWHCPCMSVTHNLLLHCLQMVNGFAGQSDAEIKGKVITRLQNITELQSMLLKCLSGNVNVICRWFDTCYVKENRFVSADSYLSSEEWKVVMTWDIFSSVHCDKMSAQHVQIYIHLILVEKIHSKKESLCLYE